jgi:hypothetical protein
MLRYMHKMGPSKWEREREREREKAQLYTHSTPFSLSVLLLLLLEDKHTFEGSARNPPSLEFKHHIHIIVW